MKKLLKIVLFWPLFFNCFAMEEDSDQESQSGSVIIHEEEPKKNKNREMIETRIKEAIAAEKAKNASNWVADQADEESETPQTPFEQQMEEREFKSSKFRLFAHQSRNQSFIVKRSRAHNLTDQEYEEYLKQKLDGAIKNNNLHHQLLVMREMDLYEVDIQKLELIRQIRSILRKLVKNNNIKQYIANSSIAACAVIVLIIANLLIKYI